MGITEKGLLGDNAVGTAVRSDVALAVSISEAYARIDDGGCGANIGDVMFATSSPKAELFPSSLKLLPSLALIHDGRSHVVSPLLLLYQK